ncbi:MULTISPECIES: GNAT family N-acetyltransferase [unclassified Modestobacter]|uniref:GNAT family N-acetyltransferase n=1 Tax=unclassified Modestobacter TaxID=2643866 RepID=UPI0022AB45F0|nr:MULTISPECIES: GNAT family N-acetyltransferase [unclassified Modestobacter]MCZ2827104.1 GNAT family N-acetyltransferase [Modestobacter sp. VKM Ac-2981]MCZ2854355.1 GNAT family N-acetyltransferase [Modestobacter sp. VKM Ac-2982]
MGQRRSPLGVPELELLAARGWQALEEERLGDWLLRAGGGFTGRANSALVVGDPGVPLPEAVAAVSRWYDDRGLRPAAQLPGVQSRRADAAFDAAGWTRDEDVLVLTAAAGRPAEPNVRVDLSPTPDDAWLAGYRHRGAPLPPVARQVLTSAADVVFASVRLDPAPAPLAAVGRGALTDGWLGVTAVTVAEEHRRRGLATAVMAALGRWAAERGAHSTYLQVTAGNAAARALYRQAGFIEHHRYHYRHRPA